MCGIPLLRSEVPTDMAKGRRLSIEQCFAHVGGPEGLITANGRRLIEENSRYFIWKYPEGAWCTGCGSALGDIRARHGTEMPCPVCGRMAEFRHEARGHRRLFWQFCLYEWRKSAIDPETVVLTATHVWQNQMFRAPESEPRREHTMGIYVFRPGSPVTVYKNTRWDTHSEDMRGWERRDEVRSCHKSYNEGLMRVVCSMDGMHAALEGTQIGRLYELLGGDYLEDYEMHIYEVAACATRPWLEYLYRCGQTWLARELMQCNRISRLAISNQRAKTPRALLGLTEAQWHEVKRDHIQLTERDLEDLARLRRMGLGGGHMGELLDMIHNVRERWRIAEIAPRTAQERRQRRYQRETIGDYLEGLPDKLRRRVFRRIIRDHAHTNEWRDYYQAMRKCGESFRDEALLLPRDMMQAHDRMIARAAALRREQDRMIARAAALRREQDRAKEAARWRAFEKQLGKYRRRYGFRAAGLELRPYECGEEIRRDGRELHICIGGYVDRYVDGQTVICCLRHAEEPDEPWRAVEFSVETGKLVQDRGIYNDARTVSPGEKRQLRAFWRAYNRAHGIEDVRRMTR